MSLPFLLQPANEAPTPITPERAYDAGLSEVTVEVSGRVRNLLPDDRDGSRHQRFILELSSGQTLLIAHNIDLAERVPLRAGDTLTVRGQYEWNAKGGVVHWTHHDPSGSREGGWIRYNGNLYR